MTRFMISRAFHPTALAVAMMFGPAGSSVASNPPIVFDWLQGEACPNFGMHVELDVDSAHLTSRTFIDKNGNPVRFFLAGKNFAMKFVNTSTNATYNVRAEGSVQNIKLNPDGSQTWVLTGHTVITWTPPPPPTAPATIRYVGRLVITVDSSGTLFTIASFTGQTTDICAALS